MYITKNIIIEKKIETSYYIFVRCLIIIFNSSSTIKIHPVAIIQMQRFSVCVSRVITRDVPTSTSTRTHKTHFILAHLLSTHHPERPAI